MTLRGLSSAASGLQAAQAAIQTISHNIANVNTPGYTRQRAQFSTSLPYQTPAGFIGTGVNVDTIDRLREQLQDERSRIEGGRQGGFNVRADLLEQTELRLGELEDGVQGALDAFFNAFEELSIHPDRDPIRQTVLSSMEELTARVRGVSEGLDQLRTTAQVSIGDQVNDLNTRLLQVASLNEQITTMSTQGGANDLMDKRAALLDELSEIGGVTVLGHGNEAVRVSISGMTLVDGNEATLVSVDASYNVVHPDGPVSFGGKIGGNFTYLNNDLPGYQQNIDDFATLLATEVNNQNAAGFISAGTNGPPLLDATGGANGLTTVFTSTNDLAVASDDPPQAFDGRNAAAMAELRFRDVGGTTLKDEVRNFVLDIAVDVQRATNDRSSQQALVNAASASRDSFHGVNLDEEMALLVAFQRGLEASARVLSAMDEALATLVNM